ncbi:MAG: alpha/beta fold hydrolase [Candidatus Thorarchaeota archaeon]
MSRLNNWTEHYFDTQGSHIRYFRTGGDKPSMILLHGAMDNGLCWSRVAKALENDFVVVMPDARGHGRSISHQKEFTLSDIVDDTAELIKHLKFTPVIVMGHSMGAQVATELGARYPNFVKKLILEDPGYFFKNPTFLDLWYYKRRIRRIKRSSLVQIREFCDKIHRDWQEVDKRLWLIAQKEWAENKSKTKSFDPKRNWHEIFPRVKSPTLLLISENGIVQRLEAEQYIAEFVNAKYQFIEKSGHHIHRENFEAFMKSVQEFLK